jgi:hypothetical protein
MKRMAWLFLLMALPLATIAVENGQVLYAGGTIVSMKERTIGRLDTTSPTELKFEYSGSKLVILFAKIDSYEYSQQVARHLGVLPAIGVGLVKRRQRKHFLRISYRDESDTSQVAIFEVPKQMPSTLLAILQERAPQGCKPSLAERCTKLSR